mmetsp:Transcript_35867/g.56059  ORF Transcript_35867/g.56059 Transcript_35867/m.56059 type:complete len:392 (+) Transcript_35867:389-1564(+)
MSQTVFHTLGTGVVQSGQSSLEGTDVAIKLGLEERNVLGVGIDLGLDELSGGGSTGLDVARESLEAGGRALVESKALGIEVLEEGDNRGAEVLEGVLDTFVLALAHEEVIKNLSEVTVVDHNQDTLDKERIEAHLDQTSLGLIPALHSGLHLLATVAERVRKLDNERVLLPFGGDTDLLVVLLDLGGKVNDRLANGFETSFHLSSGLLGEILGDRVTNVVGKVDEIFSHLDKERVGNNLLVEEVGERNCVDGRGSVIQQGLFFFFLFLLFLLLLFGGTNDRLKASGLVTVNFDLQLELPIASVVVLSSSTHQRLLQLHIGSDLGLISFIINVRQSKSATLKRFKNTSNSLVHILNSELSVFRRNTNTSVLSFVLNFQSQRHLLKICENRKK